MQETIESGPADMIVNVTARDFDQRVIQSDIPVLVDFWAPWCGPCQQLAPVLDALVARYPGKLRVAKVNVDEEQTLASGFNVRSIPMLLLFSNGKVVEEMIGLQNPAALEKRIAPHIPKGSNALRKQIQEALLAENYAKALPLLEQSLAEDPHDTDSLVDLARVHLALGDPDAAEARLKNLPPAVASEHEIHVLRSEIKLARTAVGADDVDALQQRLAGDPDNLELRYQLARAAIAKRDFTLALQQFFALMQSDRSFRGDAGRDGLLSIFEVLGGADERVQAYRRKMANLLN